MKRLILITNGCGLRSRSATHRDKLSVDGVCSRVAC
jgi:hypothetical protein